ncbi:MAG: tetratricopeptide repeat protein [Candidatus Thorarchaeota archaeon]
MTDSINKILENGYQLQSNGKTEEALQLMNEFKEKTSLTPIGELKIKIFKGFIEVEMGEADKALGIGEELYQESLRLGKPLLSIESIFLKFLALFLLWRPTESWKDVENCELLLKSATQESSSEFEVAEAIVYFLRGFFYFWEGKYDLAIEYQKKSILIFEQFIRFTVYLSSALWVIGGSYASKGELDEALKSFLKSLEINKGYNLMSKGFIAANNNSIGHIYYQQEKLDLAIENIEKSLRFFETKDLPLFVIETGMRTDSLVKITLDKKSLEGAQGYLQRYHEYLERHNISENFYWYLLPKARILRSSTRTRDRAEAERILLQLIERIDNKIIRGDRGLPEESPGPIIELCDYYLEELRLTNDMGVLDDIHPLINRLLKEAKRTNSFSLHSHALLLQGKISLLQMNMGDARRYLTQAQQIAESHGFQSLARAVSIEHDNLLEQLHKWEILEQNKAPISERMNLALLDDTVDSIQGKLAINPPELSDEIPLLLLIISEGGLLTFSYPFVNEWDRDNELFGSFLTAFNSISDEYFSEGIDRVKFGQQTALMRSNEPFLICYLFKGQSYKAIQKLDKFTSLIQKDSSVQKILNKYYQTGQVLELKDFPFLESLIKEIFT